MLRADLIEYIPVTPLRGALESLPLRRREIRDDQRRHGPALRSFADGDPRSVVDGIVDRHELRRERKPRKPRERIAFSAVIPIPGSGSSPFLEMTIGRCFYETVSHFRPFQ